MASARPVLFSDGAPRALERIALHGRDDDGASSRYSERWLQELIQSCPEVLPTDEIEPGFGRLVPVAMEVACGGQRRIDNLFVTPQGGIALVETKLWRNPEARRAVVAQALDYAAALARMTYSEFEQAALVGEFPAGTKFTSLYEIVANLADAVAEDDFVDAVVANLRRGRMLVIAAGDGIRSEAEALADLLQSHAGARFTFAMVAIELFERPPNEILAVPRTIAKTVMIERGVVRIHEDKIVIEAPAVAESSRASARRTTITEEMFFEQLEARRPGMADAVRVFLDRAKPLKVEPDLLASLNLKWNGDRLTVNLGYIRKDGTLGTDTTFYTAKGAAPARRYIEGLAALTGGRRMENNETIGPYVIAPDGKSSLRIDQLLPAKADAWLDLMKTFIDEMTVEAESVESGELCTAHGRLPC